MIINTNRKRYALGTILALCLLAFVTAEESAPPADSPGASPAPAASPAGDLPSFVEFPSALGMELNTMAGWGLHWMYWKDALGISVTGGGIYQPANSAYPGQVENLDYGIFAQALLRVYGVDFAKWFGGQLYATVLLGHQGRLDYQTVYDYAGNFVSNGTGAFIPMFNAGIGIGIEFILFRHFSLPVECLLIGQYPWKLNFTATFGLRYRF
jgi:hypothetical protein